MRWAAVVQNDVRFQIRYGFYYACFFIVAVYIAILCNVPAGIRVPLLLFLLFTDTCVMGFFFVGGLVLLEKDQRIQNVLSVTPMSVKEYVTGKIVSLSLIAFLTSVVITLPVAGWPAHWMHFCTGIICSSVFYTALGLIIVVRSKNLNHYFFRSIIYSLLLWIPVLDFFRIVQSPLFYFWPTKAALVLLGAAFDDYPFNDVLPAYTGLLAWTFIILKPAERQIERFLHGEIE